MSILEEELVCYGCKWYHDGGWCKKRLELPDPEDDCLDYEEEGYGETWV